MKNSEVGIFKHGKLKTFLTRGIFKKIFQPIFYSKKEQIHYDFIQVLCKFSEFFSRKLVGKELLLATYWFCALPKNLFEGTFFEDEVGGPFFQTLENPRYLKGEESMHISIAYILWHLERILMNDVEYCITIGMRSDDIQELINRVLGENNAVVKHLKDFREKFGQDPPAIDPRDWGLVYAAKIINLLTGEIVTDKTFYTDKDFLINTMEYVAWSVVFISDLKKSSLLLLK